MSETRNRALFEEVPIGQAVKTMAIPTILGQIIVLIYSLADTFFIGRANNPQMVAGASLILPVFNLTLSIAAIAGVGGSAQISRLLGENRQDEAKRVCSYSIYLSAGMAVIFSLLIWVFMEPLLGFLGASGDVRGYARDYAMCVVVLGGLPTIMSNVLSGLVRSIGESRKAGMGVTLGGVINIALDPLFMFVLLPEGQEMLGAGIATFLSNCISAGYFVAVMYKLRKKSVLVMRPIRERPEKQSVKEIFSTGLPSAISTFLFDMDYIVIDKLMSGYNDIAIAAIGIVLKAERLPLNVGVGICQGMVPIVAYNYAARNRERMTQLTRAFRTVGVCCALVSIVLYEIFAPYVIRFFIEDAETVALGTNFLRARCLATVFMFLSFFHVNLFNSYGRGKEALFLGVMRWAVFNIPMLFIMNALVGMNGIVWTQLIADIFTVALSLYVHRRFVKENFDLYFAQ